MTLNTLPHLQDGPQLRLSYYVALIQAQMALSPPNLEAAVPRLQLQLQTRLEKCMSRSP